MPVEKEILQQTLENFFDNAEINLIDLAGDNDHWKAEVKSKIFEGKNRIEQHKMVQEAVKDLDIHALSIKTKIT